MAKKPPPKSQAKEAKKPASFEQALKELQEIVRELESGEQSLDDSLKLYERGITSLRTCHTLLNEAEQRIRKLVSATDGKVLEESFDSEFTGETTEIPVEPGDISSGPTQVMKAIADTELGKGSSKPHKSTKRRRSAKGNSLFSD
jgi:exodeoxyribonuclease VII small subunit